jgi:hypothetical protein
MRLPPCEPGSLALTRGAMIVRPTDQASVFAFPRIERNERVEYLAAFNNSRTAAATVTLQTSQPAGAVLRRVVVPGDAAAGGDAILTTDAQGRVTVALPPVQFALWRAVVPLAASASAPAIAIAIAFAAPASGAVLAFRTREVDGHTLVVRQELRAEIAGGDGVAEVTFAMTRASRPRQCELLGTDDAPPYRVFWRPPPDLAPGEELAFTATVDDLRGRRAVARIDRVKVAPARISFGIRGATVPLLKSAPAPETTATAGATLRLAVQAGGAGPLEYQWIRDGAEIPGATAATLVIPRCAPSDAGRYFVLVRNRAGTAVSAETTVTIKPAGANG